MQPGLADVAADVDPDPGAVLEAHGAETVDDLVAGESAPERDSVNDRAVSRFFEGGLDRPERGESECETARAEPASSGDDGDAPTMASTVLDELERAAATAAARADGEGTLDAEAIEDGDVADALDAADVEDAEIPASVPEEWQER